MNDDNCHLSTIVLNRILSISIHFHFTDNTKWSIFSSKRKLFYCITMAHFIFTLRTWLCKAIRTSATIVYQYLYRECLPYLKANTTQNVYLLIKGCFVRRLAGDCNISFYCFLTVFREDVKIWHSSTLKIYIL